MDIIANLFSPKESRAKSAKVPRVPGRTLVVPWRASLGRRRNLFDSFVLFVPSRQNQCAGAASVFSDACAKKALFCLGALGFLAFLARVFWLRPAAALRSSSDTGVRI
jgi:hypothetical protein